MFSQFPVTQFRPVFFACDDSIDYWFADDGLSGLILASQRPQFKALLDKIRDGEMLIVIRVARLDRGARAVADIIKLLEVWKINLIVLQR